MMDALDTEQAAALTEQECAALITVVGLRNQLADAGFGTPDKKRANLKTFARLVKFDFRFFECYRL